MRTLRTALVAVAAVALGVLPGCSPNRLSKDVQERILQATVTISDPGCAGVVAGDALHVVTAGHCIDEGRDHYDLTFKDGTHVAADVVALDRPQDYAVLQLESPAKVAPLKIARALPAVGDLLLFTGRFDRNMVPQLVQVTKLGRCPSLPGVERALFTSVRGTPGDSGSPIVNMNMDVVGLVHGGALCSIATPTFPVAAVLDELHGPTRVVARTPARPAQPPVELPARAR